ncbi:hypothetical protein TNCV_1447681 [Trichonephila clavipes]|nr:hypothetical protein TNCV_1447681 [Trichonephila clavipes]
MISLNRISSSRIFLESNVGEIDQKNEEEKKPAAVPPPPPHPVQRVERRNEASMLTASLPPSNLLEKFASSLDPLPRQPLLPRLFWTALLWKNRAKREWIPISMYR